MTKANKKGFQNGHKLQPRGHANGAGLPTYSKRVMTQVLWRILNDQDRTRKARNTSAIYEVEQMLEQQDPTTQDGLTNIDAIMCELVERAKRGEEWAIKMIFDRMEGGVKQKIDATHTHRWNLEGMTNEQLLQLRSVAKANDAQETLERKADGTYAPAD